MSNDEVEGLVIRLHEGIVMRNHERVKCKPGEVTLSYEDGDVTRMVRLSRDRMRRLKEALSWADCMYGVNRLSDVEL